jgi:hypothetical protein
VQADCLVGEPIGSHIFGRGRACEIYYVAPRCHGLREVATQRERKQVHMKVAFSPTNGVPLSNYIVGDWLTEVSDVNADVRLTNKPGKARQELPRRTRLHDIRRSRPKAQI